MIDIYSRLATHKRKIYSYIIVLALIIAFSFRLEAIEQDTTQKTRHSTLLSPAQEFQNDINTFIDSPDFSNATIGISIQSLETGEYLFRYNDNKNFIPASTQKLLTTAAALEYLGPEYQFATSLYLDGNIESNGDFIGNIIIRGTGDPTMSPAFNENPAEIIEHCIQRLDSLGIKSIKGNIIGDDSFFDGTYYGQGWAYDDMIYPYSAQVNALNIYDNKIDIILRQGDNIGDPAKFKVLPDNNYVRIVNNVKTGSDDKTVEVFPTLDKRTNVIEINGVIPHDSLNQETIVSVAIDNPTLFFLNLFKKALEKRKIIFRGSLLDIDDCNERIRYSSMKPICENMSKPLKEILPFINKASHNLGCEVLLKTIAKETMGIGSFSKGIEQLKKYLKKQSISIDNISIADGSGLSRLNMISPRNQTALLSAIYRSDYRNQFIQSLAVPGKNGTLKRRMTKSLAENNLWAKTGSMNFVSTLSGYINTRDNEYFAFSIMLMNFSAPDAVARNLQDLICMRLAGFSRKIK